MTGAMIITWGAPVRGREAKGLEIFGNAVERFEQLAKTGRIHSHKEFFNITGNLGTWAGMMIVEGDIDELLKLQAEDEQLRLQAKAQSIVEHFTVQICLGGSDRSVQESMNRYVESLQGLGYL